jgi:hypothetical protein
MAALEITGDNLNPVSLPITAATLADITVSVPPIIIVAQGGSATFEICLTSVGGPATTASLAASSPDEPAVTVSLSSSSFSVSTGQTVPVPCSVSAYYTSAGSYPWTLSVYNGYNTINFAFNITVVAQYFSIRSKLGNVIDVAGASTTPGTPLDAYPWKYGGYENQLWTVVDGAFPSWVDTVPHPHAYFGTYNYILANGSGFPPQPCPPLTGVRATIYFTEDLVWQSVSGGQTPSNP